MHADDAAGRLAEMGEARRQDGIARLPDRQRRRVRVMLGEQPATAAALMSQRFIALAERATVADALDRVRTSGLDRRWSSSYSFVTTTAA